MQKEKILIADDDYIFSELTKYILTENQFDVCLTKDSQSTLDFFEEDTCDLILLDLHFPDFQTGFNTLKSLKEKNKDIPIIVITSDNLILMNRFNDLIQNGASDIIEKPLQEDRLILTIKNTLSHNNLIKNYRPNNSELIYLMGDSPKIVQIKKQIKGKLQTDNHLMLFGNQGLGLENIAKTIHNYSHRSALPVYKIDCSNMTIKDMQIAFFGDPEEEDYDKKFNNLKIVQAKNSTLLITDAHYIPIKLQEKLVRALSGRRLNSLNGNSLAEINTKLIFTTKEECYNDICADNISPMLFNLCEDQAIIPSLRERTEDIQQIMDFLISLYNKGTDANVSLSESASDILKRHIWKNNIDELQSTLLKIVLRSDGDEIAPKDVVFHDDNYDSFVPQPYKQAVKSFEKSFLEKVMIHKNGNLNDAAAVLKIDRSNLFKKLQNHGIKIKKN